LPAPKAAALSAWPHASAASTLASLAASAVEAVAASENTFSARAGTKNAISALDLRGYSEAPSLVALSASLEACLALELGRRRRLGGRGNLQRLPDTVPWRINNRHVYGLLAKERQKLLQAYKSFARSNRVRASGAYGGQGLRVERIEFHPG
jgi:hypothetical protein